MSTRPHVKVNVTSTAQSLTDFGFTAAQRDNAKRLIVTAFDGDIVYQVNGQTPTATEGHIIKQEVTTQFEGEVAEFEAISKSGSNVNTTIELLTA